MKIFGIGLSKTGTQSLNDALRILGYNAVHCPMDQTTYDELTRGVFKLSLLNKVDAITDITTVPFYQQFDSIYPNSKFILTVRDISTWLNSLKSHIEKIMLNGKWEHFINGETPKGIQAKQFQKFALFLHASVYGSYWYSEERMKFVYERHVRDVYDYFYDRQEDLLTMNVADDADGWLKLCKFLDKPIPNIEFPHKNKSKTNEN